MSILVRCAPTADHIPGSRARQRRLPSGPDVARLGVLAEDGPHLVIDFGLRLDERPATPRAPPVTT